MFMKKNRTKIKQLTNNSINISCNNCGKPIIKSNEFGMYCEDECGLEDDKKAFDEINILLNKFLNNI